MSLPARYLDCDAQLRSFEKDQLVFDGPKALAPGAPVMLTAQGPESVSVSIEARTIGSRRIGTEPVTYEIRVRIINANRELRRWLESALGSRSE